MAVTEEEFQRILQIVKDKNIYFIEHLSAHIPCNKSTFYKNFPIDSDQFHAIKDEITKNKITRLSGMLHDWGEKDAVPVLQLAFAKSVSTDLHRKLSSTELEWEKLKLEREKFEFEKSKQSTENIPPLPQIDLETDYVE